MRAAFAILAMPLALAACGQNTQSAATSAAPAAPAASSTAAVAAAPAAKKSPFAEWQLIANQKGGGAVFYHPSSIVRAADGSTGDVWVEIRYGEEQTYVVEDKTIRQTITYNRERILFTFTCSNANYAILERRLMGLGDDAVETIKTPIKSERDWRPSREGGVTAVTFGPACQSVLKP